MMFQAGLQERIGLIEQTILCVSDKCMHLVEKGEGQADLELKLSNRCILIRNLEKNKPGYFSNKKCADYVLFEEKGAKWEVHIFEMKRTVKDETWEKEIKMQFYGAMQNALALSGVLGIDIEKIILHTVYRNDKVNDISNPVKQHPVVHGKTGSKTDWNNPEIMLEFLDKKCFRHDKIKLDIETGNGEYCLSVV